MSRQLRAQELSIRRLRDDNEALLRYVEDMRLTIGKMMEAHGESSHPEFKPHQSILCKEGHDQAIKA